MDRRDFLKHAAASAVALSSARLWAAPAVADTKLLVVMLRGACDGASLLVPYSSPFYYQSRPTIAVPRPDPGAPTSAAALDADYALHPVVRDTLYTLWARKQATFIPFAGSEDRSRSHFQAQDVMELGQSPLGRLDYSSGYLNRLVAALGGRGGVSFTQNLTPIFKGDANVAHVSLRGGIGGPMPDRHSSLVSSMYAGGRLGTMAADGMETRKAVSRELGQEMNEASRGARGAGGFERQARAMAKLMRDQPEYAVGFVDVGGWDTHVNQGAAEGQLANNLGNLAQGLYAFSQEVGPAWKNTVVVVMSEFGRTFRENGSRGTDHGHGNTLWILGGAVAGGRIAGRQTAIGASTLYENRDLPVLNDYRAVLAELFGRLYGLSTTALDRVLPGATPDALGLV